MKLALLFLIYPVICYSWGKFPLKMIFRNRQTNSGLSIALAILLGLLLSNYFMLALKMLGLSWKLACIIAWVLPTIFISFDKDYSNFKFQYPGTLNFSFWIAACLVIGVSIFDFDGTIRTIWVSNYADLAYHMGMITSFTFSDNFPPEYHIYPGVSLTYPYMINFWTASFWWMQEDWLSLDYIFLYQWVFLTTLLYFLIDGNKNKLSPWAILFGGGVYLHFDTHDFFTPAAELISSNLPWTAFMETIWVPQRSALFGAVCLVAVATSFFKAVKDNYNPITLLAIALLIPCMPLVHTHMWMFTWGFCAFFILVFLMKDHDKQEAQKGLMFVFAGLLVSCLWLLYLAEKSSTLGYMDAWHTGDEKNFWYLGTAVEKYVQNSIAQFLLFWIVNWWPILLLVFVFYIKTRNHFAFLFLLVSFIFCNSVALSYWSYDQIKAFMAIYFLFIILWQDQIPHKSKFNFLLILLIIPGLFRASYNIYTSNFSAIYSKAQIEDAEMIRKNTQRDAVIALRPVHNNTVTLTGRFTYLGYTGTLWSHGIQNYQSREATNQGLMDWPCEQDICPDYIYWSEKERSYWKKDKPPEDKFIEIKPNLYRLK